MKFGLRARANTLARPPKTQTTFRKVAILFAGGPAPGANAVISTAAVSFLHNDIEVLGILHGYSHLVEYTPDKPLEEGRHYMVLNDKNLRRTRKDLLQAATRLMKQGRKPSLEEVAEEAMVSRATAYRYFSTVDALLLEAALDVAVPEADVLFENAPKDDAESRKVKRWAIRALVEAAQK